MNSRPLLLIIYIEHIVFGIIHDMRRKGVEGKEICHFSFLFAINVLDLIYHICKDNFVSWHEIVLNFLVGIVEFNNVFTK